MAKRPLISVTPVLTEQLLGLSVGGIFKSGGRGIIAHKANCSSRAVRGVSRSVRLSGSLASASQWPCLTAGSAPQRTGCAEWPSLAKALCYSKRNGPKRTERGTTPFQKAVYFPPSTNTAGPCVLSQKEQDSSPRLFITPLNSAAPFFVFLSRVSTARELFSVLLMRWGLKTGDRIVKNNKKKKQRSALPY